MRKVKSPDLVFLCGFMGSGKSSLGKSLARALNYDFIDLDHYIESNEKRSLPEIFQSDGEQLFRKLEQKYLRELLKQKGNKVIALGGGTVCFFDNLEIIKEHGYLIYLRLPVKTLCQRLSKARKERPLLKDLSDKDLHVFVEDLLEKRKPFYEQAHRIVDSLVTKPETLLNELRKIF